MQACADSYTNSAGAGCTSQEEDVALPNLMGMQTNFVVQQKRFIFNYIIKVFVSIHIISFFEAKTPSVI